ncbi:MAG: succinoglycan biosynthesis transport protein ExoP, partial [Candidatus Omnitrophota bacterium]
ENNTQIKYLESELIIQARKITLAMKASLSGQFNVSNIKILEHAKPIRKPAGPNRKNQILKQTAMGLALSLMLAIFIDSLDRSVKTDEDLQSISELPLLGQIPERISKAKSTNESDAERFIHLKDDPVIEDAFTALRTALIFSMPQGLNKRIMITSSIPGEGKSTVSHLLAHSLAKVGEKVLYIELDLRRPSLNKYLPEMNAHKAGMSELLVGQATLEEVTVQSTLHQNLKVIPAGSKSPNPTILFNSPNFDELFETVEKLYDRIIIDTPPAFNIPDAIQISQKIHGLVFVVGSGKVHKKIVEKTLNKFRFVQSIIFGTILNQVTLKTSSYYDKYRYENYGRDTKD